MIVAPVLGPAGKTDQWPDVAVMGSHLASISRRSGDTFSPILAEGQVRPNEPIRLTATGVRHASINPPEFVLTDSAGKTVFSRDAAVNLGGDAFLDTVAPSAEGVYALTVHAQTYPFLPFTHQVTTTFEVSKTAPKPPDAPPGSFNLGDIKTLGILAIVFVAAINILPAVARRS